MQDEKRPVIKIKRPKQEPPGPKPMSVGGFAENTLDNLWSIAKGLVNVFPTAIKSGAEVFGDPDGMMLLAQNPEHLVRAFRDTAVHVKDAIVEPYEKHGLRVLYEEPVTPVLDAMTILTLGGASMAKAGTLAKSEKLFKAGNVVKSVPEKIAAQIVKAPLRAVGINPETRQLALRIRRQEKAGAQLESASRQELILKPTKDFTDAELVTAERMILEGGKLADLASNPKAAALYKSLDDWLKKEREAELGSKGRAFLTDEQMQNRVIKEFAERKGLDFQTAKAQYDLLEVKPLYAPAIRESGGFFAEANAFSQPVLKKGKVGFLEKFESALGTTKDIRKRIARAIDDFYSTRANLRYIDRIIQTPGLAKVAGKGEVSLKEILPSQGIHAKYYGDRSRARSLYVSELERQHGREKALQMIQTDPATKKALNMAVNISIPDQTLRNLIRREFTAYGGDVGAFWRIYDRVTNLFRTTATKLSPRWYTGNVMGDALLASLAGSNWPAAKKLIAAKTAPRAIRSGPAGQALESGGYLNKLSDIVGAIDDTARAGIFSKSVVEKLRSTALHFAGSEDAFRVALQEVILAPDELADIMVRNQQLGEHVARNSRTIQKLDKAILGDQKKLAKLEARLAGATKDIHPVARESKIIRDRIDIMSETRDAAVADLTKNMMQREVERIPELARKAELAEQAIDRANTFLGEYLGLGPIERGVFRRAIPFFPWMKAMAKLAFTFPFIAPAKAFFWHRYQAAMADMMGDPELPEWMAAYAPVFARENGDTVWARITSLSPFGSLRTERFGGAPIPSILAFWQANPWLNVGFKLAGGKDMFSPGTIPFGENLVAINDGEVYRFNEKGKLERIVPQAPLVKSVAHMFPVVQMIDQLISNYDVRQRPVLNSDGTVKYPIELHQRLADVAGLKLMHRNREQAIKIEKIRIRKALQDLRGQYMKADPEKREYIKGIFQDYARGEYRRIEARK